MIEEPVERQQHLVIVFAIGLPQVTEFDQPVNQRFRKVRSNLTKPARRPTGRDRIWLGAAPTADT